jgi:hypothetical protein
MGGSMRWVILTVALMFGTVGLVAHAQMPPTSQPVEDPEKSNKKIDRPKIEIGMAYDDVVKAFKDVKGTLRGKKDKTITYRWLFTVQSRVKKNQPLYEYYEHLTAEFVDKKVTKFEWTEAAKPRKVKEKPTDEKPKE